MSDLTSRPTIYTIVLLFYVLGFIVAASASTFPAYVVGICFTAFSKSGLDLLSDIIVSDLTPLHWRQFFLAMLSSPYFITTYIGGFVSNGLVPDHWRWGAGMFAIMMPVLLSPVILLLYYMQWKAQKLGMVSLADKGVRRKGIEFKYKDMRLVQVLKQSAIEIDLVGLILLGFGFALLLLPFSLAKNSKGGWDNPSMIAMLVVGFVSLALYGLWEQFCAPIPMAPRRVLRNRAFLLAISIQVFSQLASAVESQYFSSYIYVTNQWTNYQWTVFINTDTVGLCFWGIVNGLLQRRFHRFKIFLVFGGVCKILAYGLLVQSDARSTTSTARLAIVQVLLGFGAFSVGGARIASQAAVAHRDLATVIFTVSLWSSLGAAVGAAISSAIWTNRMIENMVEELPNVPMSTITTIYGSIKTLRTYAPDDPIRQGAIRAYQRTNGILFITAACLAIIPFACSLFIPNFYLDSRHNLLTNKDLDGNIVSSPARRLNEDDDKVNNASGFRNYYYRLRKVWDC
ncbi:hypothetical protein CBS101457_003400 [Exobasidium rhododendri]|nr:hypothetical protein CBS101457_003400 [Exobasidium rhododendri]